MAACVVGRDGRCPGVFLGRYGANGSVPLDLPDGSAPWGVVPRGYAVFVRDPEGNNVEAVCHHPGPG